MTPSGPLGAAGATAPNGLPAGAEASATPGAGADFFALVLQLLAGSPPGDPAGGGSATVPADQPVADAPPVLGGGGSATVSGPGKVAGSPLPGEPEADESPTTDQPADAGVATAALVGLPIALLRATAAQATAAQVPAAPRSGGQPAVAATEPGTGPVDPTTSLAPAGSAHQRSADAAAPAVAPAPGKPAEPGDAADPAGPPAPQQPTPGQQAPAPTAALTPVSAPLTLAATAAAPRPAAPAPVTHQVFDEIVRVAGTGAGPRRVTVRLQPESLGEVRVVMTVRDGALRVSLAAGGAAHHTLLEGAPELQRLLESAGSAGARVVVRDLPGGAPGTPAPTPAAPAGTATPDSGLGPDSGWAGSGWGGGGWGGPGAQHPGHDRTPDRRTAPHGGSTAMDGTHDPADPPRRTESVTRTRPGVDVTM